MRTAAEITDAGIPSVTTDGDERQAAGMANGADALAAVVDDG